MLSGPGACSARPFRGPHGAPPDHRSASPAAPTTGWRRRTNALPEFGMTAKNARRRQAPGIHP